jgi:hypothetical protein
MTKKYNLYIAALSVTVFLISLIIPSTTTLLHPDSSGYIEFAEYRTAFYPVFLDIFQYSGFSIEQVPILQTFVFSVSLYYLLWTLAQVCEKKSLLIIYVFLLIGNIWLVSLHKAILTESIYISLNMAAMAALINFFNTKSVKHIAIFALMTGLAMGVRPAGIAMLALFPIIIFAAKNYFVEFRWSWIFSLFLPIIATQLVETVLYRGYHGDIERGSIMPIIIFGKGAMIKGDFKFNGPNQKVLHEFSNELDLEYDKVNLFLDKIPYFWLKNQALPNYEVHAQFHVLRHKRDYFSKIAKVDSDKLLMELGKQRMLQGINQWIKNSLYHYAASWALRVTSFPPFVKEYNDWIKSQADIPFNKEIKYLPMKGKKASIISMIAFPGLLISGLLSGIIGISFLVMLVAQQRMPLLFMLSGILSLSVHGMLIFSSFANIATPRYTTTQFPILALALLLFLFWAFKKYRHK